jgi:hypothetical protein
MSTPSRLSVLAAALTLLALSACSKSNDTAASAPSPAKKVVVDLSPAYQVGQKFSVATDLANTQHTKLVITIPGMPAPQNQNQDVETAAHIEADGQILAIFPNGSPQKVALTLKSIVATENKAAVINLPTVGANIVVDKTGASLTISVNGQPADDHVGKILRDIFDTGNDQYTDQTMFGTKNPIAVGDTWPVDSAALVASFKSGVGEVSNITGTMKLTGLAGTGDSQVATVSGDVKIDGFKPPLPPGVTMTIDSSSGVLHVEGDIPAVDKGTMKESHSMTIKMEAHGDQQGVQVKISTSGEQKKTSAITFP